MSVCQPPPLHCQEWSRPRPTEPGWNCKTCRQNTFRRYPRYLFPLLIAAGDGSVRVNKHYISAYSKLSSGHLALAPKMTTIRVMANDVQPIAARDPLVAHPFRGAMLRGLAVLCPPLLTILIVVWAINTTKSYFLEPVTGWAREGLVWCLEDVRDDLPARRHRRKTATADRDSTSKSTMASSFRRRFTSGCRNSRASRCPRPAQAFIAATST